MFEIVSLMKDPKNFSISSDYFDILFRTAVAMAPFAAINGENIKTINVNFQDLAKANIRVVIIVAELRKKTDRIPVKKL